MVSWEFEKPSEWSIGKRIGFFAIILLLLGLFFPFWVRDYGSRIDTVRYFQYETFGLLGLIPIFSALLIILLLYLNFNIYFEKDEERMKINHFILMMWSFCFILIYIADAIRAKDYSTAYATAYPGIGLWMIIFGYLFCFIAGLLEWRYPSMVGPRLLFRENKIKAASPVIKSNPSREVAPSVSIQKREKVKVNTTTPESIRNKPSTDTKWMEGVNREPKSEEEKILIRWSRDIYKDGRIYERCLKCGNYVFLNVEDDDKRIVFKCPGCGASFNLSR
jgi:hypothetical protein